MLKFIKTKDPSLKWELLKEFQRDKDCFVVSDIKTKQSLERELLKKHSFLPGFSVLRADELYKELFDSLNLKWNLTSDSFVSELFSDFCSKQAKPWIRNSQNTKSFFLFFNAFLPALFHPNGKELFQEWFQEKRKSVFWESLFDMAVSFFDFLKSKNIIHESGLKAVLFHHLPLSEKVSFPKSRLFVDLNYSLDSCEKFLFQEISRHKEVCVLAPDLKSQPLLDPSVHVYQRWEKELGKEEIFSFSSYFQGVQKLEENPDSNKTSFFKLKNSHTQIEELRKALTQIRLWKSSGIDFKDMALFAPDMELYWPALRAYLKQEQIPVKKSSFAKGNHLPDLKYFLSSVRLHLNHFDFKDLEHFAFYKGNRSDFSEFQANYFHVPGRNLVRKLLFKGRSLSGTKKMTGAEFVKWAFSFWPLKGNSSLLEKVMSIFQRFPLTESLKALSWLKLLEAGLFRLDLELEGEDPDGISCLSFNAFSSAKSPYVFIMGLSEESLKTGSLNIFNESERQSLLEDLDFPLILSHPRERENSLLWFLQSSHHREVFLSSSSYNLKGDVQTESLIYFLSEALFQAGKSDIVIQTSWEQRKKQNSALKILKGHLSQEESLPLIEKALKNERQILTSGKPEKLSASRLKIYTDCPFKYAGKYLFSAHETVSADRELSPLSKGSLAHKLFENFFNEYPSLEASPDQIEELIEKLKPKGGELIYERQWLLVAEDLKSLLNLFIEKEKERPPSLKPLAFEKKCKTFWNQEKGEMDSKGGYPFEGFVDRIDQEEGGGDYVIRDYKRSLNNLTNISSWVKPGKEELQLTFYAQALQKGLIEGLPPGEVSALFYSAYEDDFSAKGFADKESSIASVAGKSHYTKMTEKSVLNSAIKASNEWTKTVVQKMKEGEFSPRPREETICKNCFYRNWCRVETLLSEDLKEE